MKKCFLVSFIIIFLLFLVSCESKDNLDSISNDDSSTIEETSKEEDQKLIVGFTITSEQLEKAFLTEEELQEKYCQKNFAKFMILS